MINNSNTNFEKVSDWFNNTQKLNKRQQDNSNSINIEPRHQKFISSTVIGNQNQGKGSDLKR